MREQQIIKSKWTSVAIRKDNYDELAELSGKIIKGINLTIPQTIRYLAKDGLVRIKNKSDLLNELSWKE